MKCKGYHIRLVVRMIIIFFTYPFLANSQIDPHFSQYMFISPFINPGAAGINNNTELSLIYRYQWLGNKPSFSAPNQLSGSPVTQLVLGSTKIRSLNSGIGGYIMNDELGPIRNLNAKINYSYHLKVGEGIIGLGLGVGIFNLGIDASKLRPEKDGDLRIEYLKSNGVTTNYDVSGGIMYYSTKFYIGVSGNHLNSPLYIGKDVLNNISTIGRLYYVAGGYNILLNELFTLSPSILFKSNIQKFSTSSIDFSTLVKYNNEQLWGGIAFRSNDALTAIMGISLLKNNALRLSYAFDLTLLGSSAKSGTSHEIMLTFSKPVPELLPTPQIKTPRYNF